VDPELRRLLDRQAVRSVLHAYCDAVDRNDPDAAAALFTNDCAFDFAEGFQGAGRAALRDVLAAVGQFSATSHHLSNIEVSLDDEDRAHSVAYLYAWHRFPEHPAKPDAYLWGRYVDTLVRQDDVAWRIAARTMQIVGHDNFDVPWHGIGRSDAAG
jgi:uncharacterized protein (TIGR02246 family)